MIASRFSSGLILFAELAFALPANLVLPRLANGLALKPPMGWNSYNHYSCQPNEDVIKSNAQAVVDLGLQALGYHYITTDCGWTTPNRTANGEMTWNITLFPHGFPAMGEFIHNLGLGFGVYSDSGTQMCATPNNSIQVGSLYHEQTDASTFASWGADMLKYDNCYSDAAMNYSVASYTPSISPSSRFATMSHALKNTGRDMLFAICEWGVDFPSAWAPALGNSWRVTNDIIPAWRSIYRIVNQVVSQTSFAAPGQWLDLDMLEVGNNVFTHAEEQTHFTLWAILKSPLIIGAALQDKRSTIAQSSLQILKNVDVISYNQDNLAIPANLTRRYTQAQYDVWSGPLSGGRTVAALINWANVDRYLELDLPDAGLQSARTVKDIWNNVISTNVKTSYSALIPAHGTLLLELGETAPAGLYDASLFTTTSATSFGKSITFQNVYALTSSASHNLIITFDLPSATAKTLTIRTSSGTQAVTATLPANALSASLKVILSAGSTNTITIITPISHASITTITVSAPSGTFYPATSFSSSGVASLTPCYPGMCTPVGSYMGWLSNTGAATLSIPRASSTTALARYVEVSYTNNDVALATSWTTGTNSRNITIQVNNGPLVRLDVPLAGRHSELFSFGHGWQDVGTLGVLVPGWGSGAGNDVVVVSNAIDGAMGVQPYGANLVGIRVLF